jgi:ribosomal subunit interface protein
MHTNIVFRHVDIDKVLETQVLEEVKYLENRFDDLLTIKIVIDRDYNNFKQCHVLLSGKGNVFINAKCARPSKFTAVMDAFDEAERKLLKLEEKRKSHFNQLSHRDRLLLTTRRAWFGIQGAG